MTSLGIVTALTNLSFLGCHVVVLFDYVGTQNPPIDALRELEDVGGHVISFHPLLGNFKPISEWQWPFKRTHRKLLSTLMSCFVRFIPPPSSFFFVNNIYLCFYSTVLSCLISSWEPLRYEGSWKLMISSQFHSSNFTPNPIPLWSYSLNLMYVIYQYSLKYIVGHAHGWINAHSRGEEIQISSFLLRHRRLSHNEWEIWFI